MISNQGAEVTTAELRIACEELLEQVLRWRHPDRFEARGPERPKLVLIRGGRDA